MRQHAVHPRHQFSEPTDLVHSHGAMAFGPVDAALDGVKLPVVDRTEGGRTAPTAALVLAMAQLVGLGRDRADDAASARVGAVGTREVSLVGPDPLRPPAPETSLLSDHNTPPHAGLRNRT